MKENKKVNCGSVGRRFFSIMSILFMVISASMFAGCGGSSSDGSVDDSTTDSSTSDTSTDSLLGSFDVSALENDFDSNDYSWSSAATITLADAGISISGTTGASASGSVLTISSAGTYSISGTLSDGRIIVDTEDEEVVRLIFNGVNVTCTYSAPFYVANAKRTAIILADGKSNSLTDPANYTYFDDADEEEPNAALHSRDYLTIGAPSGGSGTGSLTVYGFYNDGITSKDGLIISGGEITVSALDDGIRGKDYLIVKDGILDVTTSGTGDGLLSDEEDDTEKGYIIVEDGTITINAAEDAIQAETYVVVYDGEFDLTSGGGSGGSLVDDESKKGIKGVAGVMIEDGYFVIDSADDAIHSNDFIVIDYGEFDDIASGDDGLHADLLLNIYNGTYNIFDCYEGIESYAVTIDDGDFYIVSDDDGLNAAGGADGSGAAGGGDGGMPTSSSGTLNIDGGYIAIYSNGDSLDSNGSSTMTGGTVLVHAPSNDNGALDYGSGFVISGGLLVTAGGPGMGETPSTSSTQNYKKLTFSQRSAGTLIHIESSSGTDLVTFEPAKNYSVFIVSSPDLEDGTTYNVYFGGSYSGGTETDGLYEGGTYSGGSQDPSLSFSL